MFLDDSFRPVKGLSAPAVFFEARRRAITTRGTPFLPYVVGPATTSPASYVNPFTVMNGMFCRHENSPL